MTGFQAPEGGISRSFGLFFCFYGSGTSWRNGAGTQPTAYEWLFFRTHTLKQKMFVAWVSDGVTCHCVLRTGDFGLVL